MKRRDAPLSEVDQLVLGAFLGLLGLAVFVIVQILRS